MGDDGSWFLQPLRHAACPAVVTDTAIGTATAYVYSRSPGERDGWRPLEYLQLGIPALARRARRIESEGARSGARREEVGVFGANAWRIGRIGGVEVRIDPSWSVIAFLIGFSFFSVLAAEFPDTTPGVRGGAAAAMTIVFFASILLHELAHSWTAKPRGVEVKGITLFLFGGATEAELDTEEPVDELVIALAGPLTSLLLGGVLWAVSAALGPGLVGFATGQLAFINAVLAVFNLVPGYPLDGGRVLRSLVWRSTGDVVRATRVAARAGQLFGYVLMGVGLAEILVLGALVAGLWLVAIGWFLGQSAQASFAHLQVARLLAATPARRVMSRDLVAIPAELTIAEAVETFFLRHDYGAFPVVSGSSVVGIVSLSAVRAKPRDEWAHETISAIASPLSEECVVEPSAPMDTVVEKLNANVLHRVAVVEPGGGVVGFITARDLARWIERSEELGLTEPLTRRP